MFKMVRLSVVLETKRQELSRIVKKVSVYHSVVRFQYLLSARTVV